VEELKSFGKMNYVLMNVWKGEAENNWDDEMGRIFLGQG